MRGLGPTVIGQEAKVRRATRRGRGFPRAPRRAEPGEKGARGRWPWAQQTGAAARHSGTSSGVGGAVGAARGAAAGYAAEAEQLEQGAGRGTDEGAGRGGGREQQGKQLASSSRQSTAGGRWRTHGVRPARGSGGNGERRGAWA
nr:protein argonaute 2-like [Aegilops tauschii subsp. strangulata]